MRQNSSVLIFLLIGCILGGGGWLLLKDDSTTVTIRAPGSAGREAPPGKSTDVETSIAQAEQATEALRRVATTSAEVTSKAGIEAWSPNSDIQPTKGLDFAAIRNSRIIPYRSSVLNPEDKFIRESARAQLDRAFADAMDRLDRLRNLKFSIAQEEILALAAAGEFVRVGPNGNVWQLSRNEPGTPAGDWHIYTTADGHQYQVRWKDLTCGRQTDEVTDWLDSQVETMVVEFFATNGLIDRERRDLLMQYFVSGGKKRLKQLASTDPGQYRQILRQIATLTH